jgi:Ni,Fe-hydrogenase III large subunit
MAARESTYKGKLGEWERLMAMIAANNGDLAHATVLRERLTALMSQVQELAQRQAVHTAAKQEASKEIRTLMVEGDRLASLLRGLVKQNYGVTAEKLAEFGVQPFRGRKRKVKEEPTTAEPSR